MTTSPVTSITDELIAELEAAANAAISERSEYIAAGEPGLEWNRRRLALQGKAEPATILALLAERADLKRQLAAASVDAERLDWLIKEDCCVVQEGTNGFWLQWIDEYDHSASEYQVGSHRTAREAIDAARNIAAMDIGSGD